jgi:hypothetical protein
MPFDEQVRIHSDFDAMTSGMKIGVADLQRWKGELDIAYRRKDWARAQLFAVEFDAVLPFVVAFAHQPEWDFEGRRLQHLLEKQPGQASLTVTATGGRTLALFSWFDGSTGIGARLSASFEAIKAEDRASALLRHSLAFSENIHMRPSWWAALSKPERDDALALIRVGMPVHAAPPELALMGRGPLSLPPVGSRILTLT